MSLKGVIKNKKMKVMILCGSRNVWCEVENLDFTQQVTRKIIQILEHQQKNSKKYDR